MTRLASWLELPSRGDSPIALLRFVRRIEIVTGLLTLATAAVVWSGEWWNWCLAAIGLAGISPWPGVGAGAQPSSSS
jgi:hypothetical protein